MSQENVEIVRKLYRHWERGDFATADFLDPDVEFARYGSAFADLEGEWRGLDETWTATKRWLREWENLQMRPVDFTDLGDDRVLVWDIQTGRGKNSGILVEHKVGWLFTVRAGKIVRFAVYWDPAEALEAAGLSE